MEEDTSTDRTITVSMTTLGNRVILAALLLGFAVFVFYGGKWGLANSISTRAETIEVAEYAAELSPADPQTHFTYAVLLDRTFDPEAAGRSNSEFQTATALAPQNYLLWLEVGRSLERKGEPEKALAAFRLALELAPNYAQVKWALGNALLRQGERNEAMDLLVEAAEGDDRFADAAARLVWQFSEGDIAAMSNKLAPAPRTRSRLIAVMVGEKRLDEALRMWMSLPDEFRSAGSADAGKLLLGSLIEAKRFRDALQIFNQLVQSTPEQVSAESVTNGDFERREQLGVPSPFDWTVTAASGTRAGVTEGQKRSGSHSLLLGFPAGSTDLPTISQTIAVEPERSYIFEIFVRSALTTGAAIRWEIVNTTDGSRIASSDPMPPSADWSPLRTEFKVPAATDGITIRLTKECPAGACTIEGNLWFDDAALLTL